MFPSTQAGTLALFFFFFFFTFKERFISFVGLLTHICFLAVHQTSSAIPKTWRKPNEVFFPGDAPQKEDEVCLKNYKNLVFLVSKEWDRAGEGERTEPVWAMVQEENVSMCVEKEGGGGRKQLAGRSSCPKTILSTFFKPSCVDLFYPYSFCCCFSVWRAVTSSNTGRQTNGFRPPVLGFRRSSVKGLFKVKKLRTEPRLAGFSFPAWFGVLYKPYEGRNARRQSRFSLEVEVFLT